MLPAQQSLPKLDQHRVIKAGIAELQPNRYFQSSRPRTASAACRSDNPSPSKVPRGCTPPSGIATKINSGGSWGNFGGGGGHGELFPFARQQ